MCELCQINWCNQSHVLNCPAYIGINQLIIYTKFGDSFDDSNMEEQCFIASILMENLKNQNIPDKTDQEKPY